MVATTRCRMRTVGLPASRTTTARATNAAMLASRCPFSRHPRLRGNDERGFPHSDSSLPIPGLPMFFRNLTLFRFPASLDLSDLDDHLAECTLKPVGGLELSSRGFVSPFGRDAEALSHRIEDPLWPTAGGRDKIVSAAVVNDLLGKQLAEREKREGRKPGGRRSDGRRV